LSRIATAAIVPRDRELGWLHRLAWYIGAWWTEEGELGQCDVVVDWQVKSQALKEDIFKALGLVPRATGNRWFMMRIRSPES
jgi:hypothetical protein